MVTEGRNGIIDLLTDGWMGFATMIGFGVRCSVFGVGVGVINLCHFHTARAPARVVVRSFFSERSPDRRATALRTCELLSVASRPGRLRPSVGVSA
jgi:hypothetical protein